MMCLKNHIESYIDLNSSKILQFEVVSFQLKESRILIQFQISKAFSYANFDNCFQNFSTKKRKIKLSLKNKVNFRNTKLIKNSGLFGLQTNYSHRFCFCSDIGTWFYWLEQDQPLFQTTKNFLLTYYTCINLLYWELTYIWGY